MKKDKEIYKLFEDVLAAESEFAPDVSGFSADGRIARKLVVADKNPHARLRRMLVSLCAVFVFGLAVIPVVYSVVKQTYQDSYVAERIDAGRAYSLAGGLGAKVPDIDGYSLTGCRLVKSWDRQRNLHLELLFSENNSKIQNIDLTIILQKDYIYSMVGLFEGLDSQTGAGGIAVAYKIEQERVYAKFEFNGFTYYLTAPEEDTNLLDDIVQSLSLSE